jgi:hypothetical protein
MLSLAVTQAGLTVLTTREATMGQGLTTGALGDSEGGRAEQQVAATVAERLGGQQFSFVALIHTPTHRLLLLFCSFSCWSRSAFALRRTSASSVLADGILALLWGHIENVLLHWHCLRTCE